MSMFIQILLSKPRAPHLSQIPPKLSVARFKEPNLVHMTNWMCRKAPKQYKTPGLLVGKETGGFVEDAKNGDNIIPKEIAERIIDAILLRRDDFKVGSH